MSEIRSRKRFPLGGYQGDAGALCPPTGVVAHRSGLRYNQHFFFLASYKYNLFFEIKWLALGLGLVLVLAVVALVLAVGILQQTLPVIVSVLLAGLGLSL